MKLTCVTLQLDVELTAQKIDHQCGHVRHSNRSSRPMCARLMLLRHNHCTTETSENIGQPCPLWRLRRYDLELKPEDLSLFDVWCAAVHKAIVRSTHHEKDDSYMQYKAHIASPTSRPLVVKLMSYDVSRDGEQQDLLLT